MGLHKSPAKSKQEPLPAKSPSPSPSSAKGSSQKPVFSRSFGVYFPRSSAQIQPRPPDVTELLRLVEELRERESLLKTELVGQKLLKETVAIVPVLENEIASKNAELERSLKMIEALRSENERLKEMFEEATRESERKIKAMEEEIDELKKTVSDQSKTESSSIENDELSSSQRFQGLMEVTVKSNLIKNLKKGVKCAESSVCSSSDSNNHKLERQDSKREDSESEKRKFSHSRCNSEELVYSFESTHSSIRPRVPRVPNPPPKPSSAASVSSHNKLPSEKQIPPPPPPPPLPKPVPPPPKSAPPPPPPPPKGLTAGSAKVRRVPEVVEFYHSLMRRDSRRDSGAGVAEVLPVTANARDMIGEIENRSAHLLAVSVWSPVCFSFFDRFATVLTLTGL